MNEERQDRGETIPPETIAGIREAIDGLTEHEARELLKELENLQHQCKERIIHAKKGAMINGGDVGRFVTVENDERDDDEKGEEEEDEDEEQGAGLEGVSGNELTKLKVNQDRS
jgi:hypothetical protein